MRRLRPRCAMCKSSPAPFRCNLDDAFFCGPCFEKHGSAHPQGRAQDAFEQRVKERVEEEGSVTFYALLLDAVKGNESPLAGATFDRSEADAWRALGGGRGVRALVASRSERGGSSAR